jgi:hypothetical protein
MDKGGEQLAHVVLLQRPKSSDTGKTPPVAFRDFLQTQRPLQQTTADVQLTMAFMYSVLWNSHQPGNPSVAA